MKRYVEYIFMVSLVKAHYLVLLKDSITIDIEAQPYLVQ